MCAQTYIKRNVTTVVDGLYGKVVNRLLLNALVLKDSKIVSILVLIKRILIFKTIKDISHRKRN